MRRLRFLPALLLAMCTAVHAAECPPPAPPLDSVTVVRAARDRGFLWRLEKDGRASWLYGTVHANRLEWALPGPRTAAALAASDVLALELDPADPGPSPALLTAGDPARAQRVAGELRPRIGRLAAAACMDDGRLRALPPLLQLLLLDLQDARRAGFHPELGVEAVLAQLARGRGMRVVGLETPAAQSAALLDASEEDERELVRRGVEEFERGENRAAGLRMMQAWADGDLAALAAYPHWCACADSPAERRYLRRLNDDRNGPMAERLTVLHASGSSFFAAVGALHMTGPQALPLLLRLHGFAVRPVSFDQETTR